MNLLLFDQNMLNHLIFSGALKFQNNTSQAYQSSAPDPVKNR